MDAFRSRGGQDAHVRFRRDRRRPGDAPGAAPPSTRSAVGRFLLGTMLAILVVGIGGFFALRSVAINESERNTQERIQHTLKTGKPLRN